MNNDTIQVNRAPVLTLWATVVAERLGYDRNEALTLGKVVAGLNAQSKGRSLGIFDTPDQKDSPQRPRKAGPDELTAVALCGRLVQARKTELGLRAMDRDQPVDPASVDKYL
jgi:hypothetical protein